MLIAVCRGRHASTLPTAWWVGIIWTAGGIRIVRTTRWVWVVRPTGRVCLIPLAWWVRIIWTAGGLGSFGPLGGFGLLGPLGRFGPPELFGSFGSCGCCGAFGLSGFWGPGAFGLLGAFGFGLLGGRVSCASVNAFSTYALLF